MSISVEKAVVKLGTETNMNGSGIRRDRQEHVIDQVAQQRSIGNRLALVLSGAIAMADSVILSDEDRDNKHITPQMRATRGNAAFIEDWRQRFDELQNIGAGEFLITHHELDYRPEVESFDDTIEGYWSVGWVPLINENGSTDNKETKKLVYGGDNDGLAEVVADRTDANRIYFLTEVEGVIGLDGKLIEIVDENNIEEVLEAVGEAGVPGPGAGMRTKVDAAWEASGKGRTAHIACVGYNFEQIQTGEAGTLFVPR